MNTYPSAEYPQFFSHISYGHTRLHTLDVCLPRPLASGSGVWIVYLHGGAWRDPALSSNQFSTALTQLLATPSPFLPCIAGLASINYRLSPYLRHSTDPSNPADPARNATHPQHVEDVFRALLWLKANYDVGVDGRRWILVGHSCGATMAFQYIMMQRDLQGAAGSATTGGGGIQDVMQLPIAVVGLEGLYDLPLLQRNHADQPVYTEILEGALGRDQRTWTEASPVNGEFVEAWPEGRLVLLGQSVQDELVEWEQVDVMARTLREQGWNDRTNGESGSQDCGDRHLEVITLTGLHDDIWSNGTELVRAIERALEILSKG